MRADQSKYLPNWDEARQHRKASKVGFFDQMSKNMCHCCQQKIDKEQIPLCENTKSLEFLGFGFPLFYMFIRNCIILLILLIISNNFISLYISINDGNAFCNSLNAKPAAATAAHFLSSRAFEHYEEEAQLSSADDNSLHLVNQCSNFMILFARTDRKPKDYETVLRIGSFIIHVLGLLYIKDKIIKTWDYYDQMASDLSDYAVLVKRIPSGMTGVRGRLTKMIANEARYDGKPFNIHEIILIPESAKIQKLHQEQEEAIEHFLKAKEQKDPHAHHLFQELQKLNHEKHHLVQHTIAQINSDKISSENAIIIFESQPQKQNFLEEVQRLQNQNKMDKYFDNPQQSIVIIQAPEPKEINYENLPFEKDRVKNICIGWSLSILFLAVITVVFYFIQLLKTNTLVQAIEQAEENPSSASGKKTFATILAWVTLLGIVFFNKFVMGRVLHYFTHLQKHDNKAHEDFSFAFKYALGMFFTTAIMTLLVEALKYHNYYKHDFGVIEEQTIMFFLCAFLVPLIWWINPFQLYHIYERNKHEGKNDVSQHQANHLMADYHYDMGKRYAELIQMMWFTFLYADLIPLGAFLILIGFSIYYWVDKFNLLRRASLEGNISGDLAMKALFLLDMTLFWRFLGELIFDTQIRDGSDSITLIFLALSVIYMIIPWDQFLEIVNNEGFKLNDKNFTSEKERFQHDNYRSYHPIYSHISDKKRLGEQELLLNDIFQLNLANNAAPPSPHQNSKPVNFVQPNLLQPVGSIPYRKGSGQGSIASDLRNQPQVYQGPSPLVNAQRPPANGVRNQ